MDFGLRCALAGREGVYVPSAIAHHRGSSTLGRWNSDTVRLISRNQVVLAAKHFRGQPLLADIGGPIAVGLGGSSPRQSGVLFAGKVRRTADGSDCKHPSRCEPRFAAIVEDSEKEIFELERQQGSDWYWRVYFWLLRR